jgi:methyl-CpG-binding domain protein 4
MAIKPGWIPPRSPYSLIQEDLWPDEYMILVSCVMLNCTSRKQVEKVLPEFRRRWPSPRLFKEAPNHEVVDLIRSLGFSSRRTLNLKKMTEAYLAGGWSHARELPGIGDYGAAAWEIFCRGVFSPEPPKDHALTQYWSWFRTQFLT